MAIRATCDGCFMEYKVPDRHFKGQAAGRALISEGSVKLQAYPVPYFISGDRTWTLPVVEQINHEG